MVVLLGKFFKFGALRSLLRPFLNPSALYIVLGRLHSDPIWQVHIRQIYGLIAYWFEHAWHLFLHYTFPDHGSTNFVQPRKRRTQHPGAIRAAVASRGRQTLKPGPNYATLVWHSRHLACGQQASIFPAYTSMCWGPLKKIVPKIGLAMAWATGPAPPALMNCKFWFTMQNYMYGILYYEWYGSKYS